MKTEQIAKQMPLSPSMLVDLCNDSQMASWAKQNLNPDQIAMKFSYEILFSRDNK